MQKILLILLPLISCAYSEIKFVEKVLMSCEKDEDCFELSESSKCVENSCNCENDCNFNVHTSTVTRVGETCTSSKDCLIDNSYCLDRRCTCKQGFVESLSGKICLNISNEIGDGCLEDRQCSASISDSICQNKTCECPIGRKLHLRTCLQKKELNEPCDSSYECVSLYSTCNNTCQCVNNYMQFKRECLLIPRSILSSCRENAQCEYTLGNNAICKDGSCMCQELYHLMQSTNKCKLNYLLGEKCGSNSECHQPGGEESRLECILGECKCKSHFNEFEGFCISGGLSLAALSFPVLLILVQALLRL